MSLKDQFIAWQLNRSVKKLERTVKVINLERVKSAGILWKIDDHIIYQMLANQLKKRGIKVSSLCYADQPGSVHGELIFSPDDFTFFGKLRTREITSFIKQEFDLLIDISLATAIEVQFVRALSKAKFKTGWSQSTPDYFDLSIDVHKRKEPSYLAEQLIHYLSEINRK